MSLFLPLGPAGHATGPHLHAGEATGSPFGHNPPPAVHLDSVPIAPRREVSSPARIDRLLSRSKRNGTVCYISVTCQAGFNAKLEARLWIQFMNVAVWFYLPYR